MTKPIFDIIEKVCEILYNKSAEIIAFITMLASIVIVIYGLIKFIQYTVDQKLEHPDTIKKITGLIRPIVIFNSKEIILADQGAMGYIESLAIKLDEEDNHTPEQIIINFNKHIQLEPILESADMFNFEIEAVKGTNKQWIFNLSPIMTCGEISSYRFRLEILV